MDRLQINVVMKMCLWIVFVCLANTLTFTQSNAQDCAGLECRAQYDPSFWKEDLKLRIPQRMAIQKINNEYYEHIIRAFQEKPNNQEALQEALSQNLIQRNRQILQVLTSRQRHQWRRILYRYDETWQADSSHEPRMRL